MTDPAIEPAPTRQRLSFQARVREWTVECFGEDVTNDITERNHRFLEEALELVQSTGCTADEAHMLVDYVFGRPVGETPQEIGGVAITFAALGNAVAVDINAAAATELSRVWGKIDAIRTKHATKPRNSPLPGRSAA